MKKVMHIIALIVNILTIVFVVLYDQLQLDILLTLAITLGTTAYHFDMRLLVGIIVDCIMHNKADYHKKWYQPLKIETRLYEILKVKSWKDKMPTYSPDLFSLEKHSLEEIVQGVCQSEIVHEIIVILSFVPILVIPIFGADMVFIITSLLAACLDMMFVIMQRYNRPRIVKLIEKRNKSRY